MESSSKNLIMNLKKIRGNLSQAKMAELVGLSLRQYVRYEKGESWPPPETLEKIAKALKVTPEFLITDPNKVQSKLTAETAELVQQAALEAAVSAVKQSRSEEIKQQREFVLKSHREQTDISEKLVQKNRELADEVRKNQETRDDEKVGLILAEIETLNERYDQLSRSLRGFFEFAREYASDVLTEAGVEIPKPEETDRDVVIRLLDQYHEMSAKFPAKKGNLFKHLRYLLEERPSYILGPMNMKHVLDSTPEEYLAETQRKLEENRKKLQSHPSFEKNRKVR